MYYESAVVSIASLQIVKGQFTGKNINGTYKFFFRGLTQSIPTLVLLN